MFNNYLHVYSINIAPWFLDGRACVFVEPLSLQTLVVVTQLLALQHRGKLCVSLIISHNFKIAIVI